MAVGSSKAERFGSGIVVGRDVGDVVSVSGGLNEDEVVDGAIDPQRAPINSGAMVEQGR